MSFIEIDAKGLACPKPVLETKKALNNLQSEEGVVTTVDNKIAIENLKKLVKKLGFSFDVEDGDNEFKIKIYNSGEVQSNEVKQESNNIGNKCIIFTSNKIGKGDDDLGEVLMKGYIYTLNEMDILPKTLMFVNSGVTLTTKGSESIEDLKLLESKGVEILSCGTCLDYLHIDVEDLKVGSVTNMYTIVDETTNSENTITIG